MCRIAGITSTVLPLQAMERAVAVMCRVMRHGGPDDEGLYTDTAHRLVLGHRRLALLDLQPTGHQPMHYATRFTITFNGEIYNYRELKAELQNLGYTFRSSGDTEVILAAFAAWGTAAFARLSGMFAFALFDCLTADLYLVRDAAGIKPIYYSIAGGTLAFASEMRAFCCLPQPPAPNPRWPVYLMAYGHLPEPVTTLEGVEPLRKGCYLKYNLHTGAHRVQRYDHLSFMEKAMAREAALSAVRTTLQQAVVSHLHSDASLGVFLSGGLDSSILALIAGDRLGAGLQTLSLDVDDTAFSEGRYQQQVKAQLASQHCSQRLKEADFHLHLPTIMEAMDLPSCDGLNTWFIAKLAREHNIKAVLSGIGADELFGGYPSFRRAALATRLQGLPAGWLRRSRYSGDKKLRRLAYLSLSGAKGLYLFFRGYFTPQGIARYLDLYEEEVWDLLEEEPVFADIHHLSPGNKASWVELNLYLQNQLLRDADVMSMAHGVEIRVPFLDPALIRLLLSLDAATKYSGRLPKQLLIDAFAHRLPPAVWNRPKMGFAFPFAAWLQRDEWVRSCLHSGGRRGVAALDSFDRGHLPWSGLFTILLLRNLHEETAPAFFDA